MIGDRVREAREAAGLSQSRLAMLARNRHGWHTCRQTTISRIEEGGQQLKLNEAAVLAAILNVTLNELAGVSEVSENTWRNEAVALDAALTRIRAAVNEAVRDLP